MSRHPLLLIPVCLGLAAAACGETDRVLKVTGIHPDRGDVGGDTLVIIKGNRFVADGPRRADVYFGNQQTGFRKGTVVRFDNDKELIVKTPAGKVGEVADVLVWLEPGGRLTIPQAFTYIVKGADLSIDGFDPAKGRGKK
jgi:hypothetical protein